MLFVGIGWSIIGVYCGSATYMLTGAVTNEAYAGLEGSGYASDGSFTWFISADPNSLTPLVLYIAVPMVTVSYICVIAMSFAVWWHLRRLRSLMSPEQQQFQHEVNIVLWIEALTPFITVVLPIYLGLAKVAIPTLPVDWFAELNFILTLSGPTFTAILKLVSIQAFRQAFRKAKYKFMKPNKVAMVTHTRSHGSCPAVIQMHTLSTSTKHY
uniref:G_PROTEIN_RECEP_F1_2 domain-containing protein n=1 Tax=Panagrellus redivivus TaxID=6233 RepID=A0A7E4W4E6_PANRE